MVKKGMTPEKAIEVQAKRGIGSDTKLKRRRVMLNMSQSELSEKAKVAKRTIQQYEQRTAPIEAARLNTLCDLSDALDCRIDDILEDENLIERFKKVK